MSVESAKAFVERMQSDEAFAKRVAEAESKEDRWVIVKAEGFDFTKDEIEGSTGELSDAELDGVRAAGCLM